MTNFTKQPKHLIFQLIGSVIRNAFMYSFSTCSISVVKAPTPEQEPARIVSSVMALKI